MVHGVAGVEGTGQACVRPIEDTESTGDCDFHAPPRGHQREKQTEPRETEGRAR